MRAIGILRTRCGFGSRRSNGQSIVEFTLILPILMIILLMSIDFGRVFLGAVELNNVARIGANYAADHPNAWGTPGNASQVAIYEGLITNDAAAINCTLPDTLPDPTFPDTSVLGGRARLTLTCDFQLLTPFLGAVIANPVTVGASAVFPIKYGSVAGISIAVGPPPPPSVPGAPTSVTAIPGDGQATVSWTAPLSDGGSPITGYTVTSSPGGFVCAWTSGPHVCTVSGLTNGSAYTFTVTATNAAGTGPASAASAPVTPAGSGTPPVVAFFGTPSGLGSSGGGSSGASIVGPSGTVVTFTNQSSGSGTLTYAWAFGDGGTSTTANPTHTFANHGTFTVSLTVTNSSGSTMYPRVDYVLIGCDVPNFAGVRKNDATGLWTSSGFTGPITFQAGNGNYIINTQVPVGGTFNPPPNGCAIGVTVGP